MPQGYFRPNQVSWDESGLSNITLGNNPHYVGGTIRSIERNIADGFLMINLVDTKNNIYLVGVPYPSELAEDFVLSLKRVSKKRPIKLTLGRVMQGAVFIRPLSRDILPPVLIEKDGTINRKARDGYIDDLIADYLYRLK